MSDTVFKVGDKVRIRSLFGGTSRKYPTIQVGDIGEVTYVNILDESVHVKVGDKGTITGSPWERYELISSEPEYEITYPVDIFDPKVFYTKEAQEKMWQSTTGSKWPYKDSR